MKVKHLKVYEYILKNNGKVTAKDIQIKTGISLVSVYACVQLLRRKGCYIKLLPSSRSTGGLDALISKYKK